MKLEYLRQLQNNVEAQKERKREEKVVRKARVRNRHAVYDAWFAGKSVRAELREFTKGALAGRYGIVLGNQCYMVPERGSKHVGVRAHALGCKVLGWHSSMGKSDWQALTRWDRNSVAVGEVWMRRDDLCSQ